MPFKQSGFFKYRDFGFLPFLVIMFLYRAPNIWSIISGAAVVLLGQLLRIWASGYADSDKYNEIKEKIVISGPFAHTRYPYLTANILIYSGMTLMSCALFPYLQLIVLIYFSLVYRSFTDETDKKILKEGAAGFDEYRSRVPALFIKISSYNTPAAPAAAFSWSRAKQTELRSIQAVLFFSLTLFLIWFVGRY